MAQNIDVPINMNDGRQPVYKPLVNRLRESIRAGAMEPGTLVGSEYDLARQTGLSRHSVRRAVEILMADGLVERRAGKGVFVRRPQSRTRSLQLVVGSLEWETMMLLARGAQDAGRQLGVSLQLYDAHGDFDSDLEFIRRLPESGVDGAIIGSLHNPRFSEVLFELKTQGFCFVLVDELPGYLDVPAVGTDNYAAGLKVGQELLQRGHQRIGFIGDLVAHTTRDRLDGLRDAISDAGRVFDRSLVIDLQEDNNRLGNWSEQVARCTRQLMSCDPRPSAVFFSCDAVAAHAYPVIRELGLEIPRDVSVVGFDDAKLCQWLDPMLATMRQPMREMGQVAIEILLELLRHRGTGGTLNHNKTACKVQSPRRILPSLWVPRGSIAQRT